MPSTKERAAQLAAYLSAAGLKPHVTEHHDHTSVEAELPSSPTAELWRDLLTALEAADWFGLVVTGAGDRNVWAGVDKRVPPTADAVRGHDHQS